MIDFHSKLDRISVPRSVLKELLDGIRKMAGINGIPEEISSQWARLNTLVKLSESDK